MTHGRKPKMGVNSRSKKFSAPSEDHVQTRGNSLKSRIASLEAQVKQIQEESDSVSRGVPAQVLRAIEGIGKKQRGPGNKMDDTELLLNRDNLVQWLEEHWPKIVKPLLTAKNPREIIAVLGPIAAPLDIRPTWQIAVINNPAELLQFLRSEKFRRKPPTKTTTDALALCKSDKRQRAANRLPTRQIANALAGIPKLKWRTSFDKCSKIPCSYKVSDKTATHYRVSFRS
jgi:hypothetical protein